MSLCVGCKACSRECPTGVDMAKMKIEFQHHYHARHGMSPREKLIAFLPRYAPLASRVGPILNLRDQVPGLAHISEWLLGFSGKRTLPRWQKPWRDILDELASPAEVVGDEADIIFFADTFNRYFEPENLASAMHVLTRAGYRIHRPLPQSDPRPLCCGRTFLAAGQVDQARQELRRIVDTLGPYVARGAKIVGLEPSCLLTLRDEARSILPEHEAKLLSGGALLFEELLARDLTTGRAHLDFVDQQGRIAHLHGHCHQKAADVMGSVEACLKAVPGLDVSLIESSCCGMAGAFGYQAETIEASLKMAELSLLPAVRKAGKDDLIVADGVSCRHQIMDGAKREALHVARVLDQALVQ